MKKKIIISACIILIIAVIMGVWWYFAGSHKSSRPVSDASAIFSKLTSKVSSKEEQVAYASNLASQARTTNTVNINSGCVPDASVVKVTMVNNISFTNTGTKDESVIFGKYVLLLRAGQSNELSLADLLQRMGSATSTGKSSRLIGYGCVGARWPVGFLLVSMTATTSTTRAD